MRIGYIVTASDEMVERGLPGFDRSLRAWAR
jgi:hypothetical protein